jgi:hypothetical protein
MLQMSTAFTDALVLLTSLFLALLLIRVKPTGPRIASAAGFLCTAVAAAFGVLRFGADPSFTEAHRFLSSFAAQVGVPLIAFAFLHFRFRRTAGHFDLLIVSLFLVGFFVLFRYFADFHLYALGIGAMSLLSIIAVALSSLKRVPKPSKLALTGAGLMAVAGLVIKDAGSTGLFFNIDIFHVLLSAAYLCLGIALHEYLPGRHMPKKKRR